MEASGKQQSRHAQISNAMVAVAREFTGRGPVRCRAIIDRDAVIVLMYDNLTQGERILADHGETEQVLQLRRKWQEIMRPRIVPVIEQVMERKVAGFLSSNVTEPDVQLEAFILETDDPDRP